MRVNYSLSWTLSVACGTLSTARAFSLDTTRFPTTSRFQVARTNTACPLFSVSSTNEFSSDRNNDQQLQIDDATDPEHLLAKYRKQTVKSLKVLLKERKLSCRGLKHDLIQRLVENELEQCASQDDESKVADHHQQEPFAVVKDKLYAVYMEQATNELEQLATDRELSTIGSKEELAKRLTMHHILDRTEIAFYLCNEEGQANTSEESVTAWAGVATTESLFEPGKLPLEFVMEAVQHFREQRLIRRCYVISLLTVCREYFAQLPSLIRVPLPKNSPPHDPAAKPRITVCGDTHGQFYDLLNVFERNGYPHRDNPYVMNGDYVDRGAFSVEITLTLLLFKMYDPDCIHLIRGNHETAEMNSCTCLWCVGTDCMCRTFSNAISTCTHSLRIRRRSQSEIQP